MPRLFPKSPANSKFGWCLVIAALTGQARRDRRALYNLATEKIRRETAALCHGTDVQAQRSLSTGCADSFALRTRCDSRESRRDASGRRGVGSLVYYLAFGSTERRGEPEMASSCCRRRSSNTHPHTDLKVRRWFPQGSASSPASI